MIIWGVPKMGRYPNSWLVFVRDNSYWNGWWLGVTTISMAYTRWSLNSLLLKMWSFSSLIFPLNMGMIQDPTTEVLTIPFFKAIFWGDISPEPYPWNLGLIYGRYLHLRILEFPLMGWMILVSMLQWLWFVILVTLVSYQWMLMGFINQLGGFRKWVITQTGWFRMQNPWKYGWFGGTPISGNHHLELWCG